MASVYNEKTEKLERRIDILRQGGTEKNLLET